MEKLNIKPKGTIQCTFFFYNKISIHLKIQDLYKLLYVNMNMSQRIILMLNILVNVTNVSVIQFLHKT